MSSARRSLVLVITAVAGLVLSMLSGLASPAQSDPAPGDDAPVLLNPKGETGEEATGAEDKGEVQERELARLSRLLAGSEPLTIAQAARLRARAARAVNGIAVTPHRTVTTRTAARATAGTGGTWVNQGPDPIVQVVRTTSTFAAMTGRVGALAIRKDGTILVGGAQGGVWSYDSGDGTDGTWIPRTEDSDTQAVGALAVAPSRDRIVYMGSGEGAMSGDSYYGDGIYRSSDGGTTWKHVSTLFTGQSVSDLVVDPRDPNDVYAATISGVAGSHRVRKQTTRKYGIYRSTDGGRHWKLLKGTRELFGGATDLVMDPQHPRVLWSSFWSTGIFRSTNAGKTWTKVMGDLPDGDFSTERTRFSLGLSHPAGAGPTVYTGFDYADATGHHVPARVWKTTDNGRHWTLATGSTTGSDSVVDYCGTQCFYDNEVKPDPDDPNIVYAMGSYGYNNHPQSGGIYRSTDGGATWKSLGYDLHPDFHAIAFDPTDPAHIAIGNDGGVWQSANRGGRTGAGQTLADTDWENLNGTVDPNTGALIHSTNLTLGQFTSMQTVPQVPGQYWGGTQDNGTMRKSTANDRWFDQAGGDGGFVQVDQSTVNPAAPTALPAYVFGEYFGIDPYRFGPTETGTIFGNEPIDGGIDQGDRSEFYVPISLNQGHPNQMFLGTQRVYRTDNAETEDAADVLWTPISDDLTSGCEGPAPNGGRGCTISTIGVSDGGSGVYAGTEEGWIQVAPDATTSDAPTWTRTGRGVLPNRPVNQISADRSNWRIAYAAYSGFDESTPHRRGHVFATTDGGGHWRNVTANLPDVPVNTIISDPSDSRTVYAGTDVGAFLTTNAGRSWTRLGTGMPKVAVNQLDYDPGHGLLAAGTHGRGAYTVHNRGPLPALLVSKHDAGEHVGPGSTIHYTIVLRNLGDADATGVNVTDPLPQYTRSANIGQGGHFGSGVAHWNDLTVPARSSVSLTFSVRIIDALPASVDQIVNDGITVTSKQGVGATGSPFVTPIAPQFAVSVTPAEDTQGARVGEQTTFTETVSNEGWDEDSYDLSVSGNQWPATVYADDCTTPLATTDTLSSGDSADVCVKVDVPAGAANDATDTVTLTATSEGDPTVSGSADLTSIAVAADTLVVDEDTNDPVDSAPYYTDALDANGVEYSVWDLSENPVIPESYLTAHTKVVWFTGNSYPAPLGGYENELTAFLDDGGSLFMSGQDILDQSAGTTDFVHDYLHIDWDGSEVQNDRATDAVHSVTGNPVTDGIGDVPLDHSVLEAAFEDQVTPIDGAQAAFTDDGDSPDALTFAGGYKVVFLAFPFEAYGTSGDKADLMNRAFTFFG